MPSLSQVQDAVNKQYNSTTSLVDQSISEVQSFLDGLKAIVAGLQVPAITAPQGLFLPSPIDVNAPQPNRPDLDFSLPTEPVAFQVADINIANIPPIDPIS